jgi:hypothetical protein
MAVTMKDAVFWYLMPYDFYYNAQFEGTIRFHHQCETIRKLEAERSFQISVITRAKRRHILEDGILHSHRSKSFKSYIALTGWTV